MRTLIAKYFSKYIIDKPWDCDILSIQSEIINDYIKEYGGYEIIDSLDEKFLNCKKEVKPLKTLLDEDLNYLLNLLPSKYKEESKNLKVHLFEFDSEFPKVELISKNDFIYSILINRTIIELIHNYFAIRESLLLSEISQDSIGKYTEQLQSDYYHEISILNQLFEHIFHIYSKQEKSSFEVFKYINEPFDYCEKVIAARRFLIAHELGHIFLNHLPFNKPILTEDDVFEYNQYRQKQELEADVFATELLLQGFEQLIGVERVSLLHRCKIENVIDGIISTFALFDLIESFGDWYNDNLEYPKSAIREMNTIATLRKYVDNHKKSMNYLPYWLDHCAVNNQLIARLPYTIVYRDYSISNDDWFEKMVHDFARKDLFWDRHENNDKKIFFLKNYRFFDLKRVSGLDELELKRLFNFYEKYVGKTYVNHLKNNIAQKQQNIDLYRISWDFMS